MDRRLRLTMSALAFVACLGFVALWHRSYSIAEDLRGPLTASWGLRIVSMRREIVFRPYDRDVPDDSFKNLAWLEGDCKSSTPDWTFYMCAKPARYWIPKAGLDAKAVVIPHWFFALIAGLSSLAWRPPH